MTAWLLILAFASQDELAKASAAWRADNHGAAKTHLRRALAHDPHSRYAHQFLATLYMLDGNTEAALQHWNRAGMPRIQRVRTVPDPPPLDWQLADRVMAFSPAAVLSLEEYRLTRARLARFRGVRSRIDVVAQPESDFDLDLHLIQTGGIAGRLAWLRSLPFLALNPEFTNIGGKAVSWSALVRGDPNKRRLFTEVTAPLLGDPRRHLRLYADARRETWRFHDAGEDVPFRKTGAGAEIEFIPSSAFQWRTGVEISRQRFGAGAATPNGTVLRYRIAADRGLLRLPARRFTLTAGAQADLGRLFSPDAGAFRRAEASLEAAWFPQARGSDYETRVSLRAGAAAGVLPLDETFQVGVERDTALWLRGHAGTSDGRKGSALLGRRYALAGIEWFKRIHEGGWLSIHAGPFADIARVRDVLGRHDKTLFADPGVQLRVRVLRGAAVRLSYSRGVFYAALTP